MFTSLKHLTVASHQKHLLFSIPTLFTTPTTIFTHNFTSPSLQALLENCTNMNQFKQLHAQVTLNGLSQHTLTLSKLISFSALSHFGNLQYAHYLFEKIPGPNRHMYNTLIRGYANSNDPQMVMKLFYNLVFSGISPNEFTFPFVLKACALRSYYLFGVLVHVWIVKLGFGSQVCVQNGLVNFYVGCGLVHCARKVFDDISVRSLVSWNSMIGGYAKMGLIEEGFFIFQTMGEMGVGPDDFTFVSLLSLCSQKCDVELGRFVHLCIVINGVEIDIYVQNSLMDMYAKCGHLDTAQVVFDRMVEKNVVSWTSMISAYAKHGLVEFARRTFDQMPMKNVVSWNSMFSCYVQKGHCQKALDLFRVMPNSKVVPDETTLVSVLSACCQLGDMITGKKIHDYIRSDNIKPGVTLYNALIDMYAKCGSIETALNIFLEMPEKNVVSWNAMIVALALHGYGFKAIELFEKMQADGILPDKITFTGLLSACSHSGLLDIGRSLFDRMSFIYSIPHEIEHYACMIDLFGRAGLLEEAIKLIGGMPMKPDVVIWGAMLGACRTHGKIEMGKQILKQVLELKPFSGGLYVLMSNIYCEAGKWEDMKKIRKLMKDHGIRKGNAVSSMEISGFVYQFMVDDKRHEISSDIYAMLDQITDHLKSEGYICNLSTAFLDAEEI